MDVKQGARTTGVAGAHGQERSDDMQWARTLQCAAAVAGLLSAIVPWTQPTLHLKWLKNDVCRKMLHLKLLKTDM